MLVLLCIIWGISWPMIRIGLSEIPPLSMRAASTACGAVTIFLICVVTRRSFRIPDAKTWLHVIISSLLNLVAFSVFGAFAQLVVATSRVAIIAYTMPIWAVLLAWPFLGERPTTMQAVALGLCGAGLAILIYPLTANGIPVGILLALAVGVSWAAGTVYLKWARIHADALGVASWQVTISLLILTACAFTFEGGFELGGAHAGALAATVFNGVAGNGIAYGLWFAVVQRLPAATASLGVLGSPVIGVVASMLILGDRPTAADVIGFALILAASSCVLLSRPSPAKAAPPTK